MNEAKVRVMRYLLCPLSEELLDVQLQSEAVPVSLQLLSLHVVLPTLAQDVLHPPHVGVQLTVDLHSSEHQ